MWDVFAALTAGTLPFYLYLDYSKKIMNRKRTVSFLIVVCFYILLIGSCDIRTENVTNETEYMSKIEGCWTESPDIGGKVCFRNNTFSNYAHFDMSRPSLKGSFSINRTTIEIDAKYTSTPTNIKYGVVGDSQPYRWEIIEFIGPNKIKVHWYNMHPDSDLQSFSIRVYKKTM